MDVDCGIGPESGIASNSADEISETGDFECNICFDLAQDPIVTLCGHLYCWPCLYQWLQIHSYSHECPVCKALVEEEKLVPIYGRGKRNFDPRSRPMPEVSVPNRPPGQRRQTAPAVDTTYFRGGLDPMASRRFGNLTLSALLGIIPAIFSLQANGIHDATVYGATTGVPYMFPTSFHGGFAHGFHHHSSYLEGKYILMKTLFLVLGVFIILSLIF